MQFYMSVNTPLWHAVLNICYFKEFCYSAWYRQLPKHDQIVETTIDYEFTDNLKADL